MHPETDDERPDWLVEEPPAAEEEPPVMVSGRAEPETKTRGASGISNRFLKLNPVAILAMAIVSGLVVALFAAGFTTVLNPPLAEVLPPVEKNAAANEAGEVPVYKGIRRSNDR
jgi:hypothetical protein